MSVLIVPCFIKTSWDLDRLRRLLGTVKKQSVPFQRVYVVDDASPMRYSVEPDLADHVTVRPGTLA